MPEALPQSKRTSGRVLIVADQQVQSVLAEFLENEGHRCATAGNAKDGLVYFGEQGADLVIVCNKIPDDGGAFVAELKSRAPNELLLPIILLVDELEDAQRVELLSAGAELLPSTVCHAELGVHVDSLLSYRSNQSELAAANSKLYELHEKKRILAALVVHDLRNPLSALHGNVELLCEELDDAGPVSEMTQQILDDCRDLSTKALSLVAGLLDVEELEEGLLQATPTPTPVEELIRQAGRHHITTVKARKLSLEYGPVGDMRASVDSDLAARMVENLLDNAVRYAPYKGKVLVSAERDGDDLLLRVGNNGPAVPEQERANIFGRYYRIEARRAGARANRGLGLYFCKLVAEAHGGTIAVEETETFPACFVVRFPGAVL